jgi:hypothetical protein
MIWRVGIVGEGEKARKLVITMDKGCEGSVLATVMKSKVGVQFRKDLTVVEEVATYTAG